MTMMRRVVLAISVALATASFLPSPPTKQRLAPRGSPAEKQQPASVPPRDSLAGKAKRIGIGTLLLSSAGRMLPRIAAGVKSIAAGAKSTALWLWNRLPSRMPSWWAAHGLTTDVGGQVAFMASNIAYAYAGTQLLLRGAWSLGALMLLVCAASSGYHSAQCLHGCESAPAARACTIDSVLAVGTGIFFVSQVHVEAANSLLSLLSLAFFKDYFRLGYTTSHSLWHLSTAAAALVSRPIVRRR